MAVYVCARDLAKGFFVGTHQLIVVFPETMLLHHPFQRLGKVVVTERINAWRHGFVLAGHKSDDGYLEIKVNQTADITATREYFEYRGSRLSKHRPLPWDYSTECREVIPRNSAPEFESRLLRGAENYMLKFRFKPIPYQFWDNNCNKWAQSLIEYAGGTVGGGANFDGLDLNYDGRLPMDLFDD